MSMPISIMVWYSHYVVCLRVDSYAITDDAGLHIDHSEKRY